MPRSRQPGSTPNAPDPNDPATEVIIGPSPRYTDSQGNPVYVSKNNADQQAMFDQWNELDETNPVTGRSESHYSPEQGGHVELGDLPALVQMTDASVMEFSRGRIKQADKAERDVKRGRVPKVAPDPGEGLGAKAGRRAQAARASGKAAMGATARGAKKAGHGINAAGKAAAKTTVKAGKLAKNTTVQAGRITKEAVVQDVKDVTSVVKLGYSEARNVVLDDDAAMRKLETQYKSARSEAVRKKVAEHLDPTKQEAARKEIEHQIAHVKHEMKHAMETGDQHHMLHLEPELKHLREKLRSLPKPVTDRDLQKRYEEIERKRLLERQFALHPRTVVVNRAMDEQAADQRARAARGGAEAAHKAELGKHDLEAAIKFAEFDLDDQRKTYARAVAEHGARTRFMGRREFRAGLHRFGRKNNRIDNDELESGNVQFGYEVALGAYRELLDRETVNLLGDPTQPLTREQAKVLHLRRLEALTGSNGELHKLNALVREERILHSGFYRKDEHGNLAKDANGNPIPLFVDQGDREDVYVYLGLKMFGGADPDEPKLKYGKTKVKEWSLYRRSVFALRRGRLNFYSAWNSLADTGVAEGRFKPGRLARIIGNELGVSEGFADALAKTRPVAKVERADGTKALRAEIQQEQLMAEYRQLFGDVQGNLNLGDFSDELVSNPDAVYDRINRDFSERAHTRAKQNRRRMLVGQTAVRRP
jgi:hypothetical protein